jgi:hypothetical protein
VSPYFPIYNSPTFLLGISMAPFLGAFAILTLLEISLDYDDFEKKYGAPMLPDIRNRKGKLNKKFADVFGYYEGLGALVKTSDLDIELFGRFGSIVPIWDKFEPMIYEARKRYSAPYVWKEFEEFVISIKEFYSSTSLFRDERENQIQRRKALGMPTYSNP